MTEIEFLIKLSWSLNGMMIAFATAVLWCVITSHCKHIEDRTTDLWERTCRLYEHSLATVPYAEEVPEVTFDPVKPTIEIEPGTYFNPAWTQNNEPLQTPETVRQNPLPPKPSSGPGPG